jgi:hypothetical protein
VRRALTIRRTGLSQNQQGPVVRVRFLSTPALHPI